MPLYGKCKKSPLSNRNTFLPISIKIDLHTNQKAFIRVFLKLDEIGNNANIGIREFTT